MPKIIFISGACGSGKSTFADALARHLVRQDHKTVYVIHGDEVSMESKEISQFPDFKRADLRQLYANDMAR